MVQTPLPHVGPLETIVGVQWVTNSILEFVFTGVLNPYDPTGTQWWVWSNEFGATTLEENIANSFTTGDLRTPDVFDVVRIPCPFPSAEEAQAFIDLGYNDFSESYFVGSSEGGGTSAPEGLHLVGHVGLLNQTPEGEAIPEHPFTVESVLAGGGVTLQYEMAELKKLFPPPLSEPTAALQIRWSAKVMGNPQGTGWISSIYRNRHITTGAVRSTESKGPKFVVATAFGEFNRIDVNRASGVGHWL